MNEVFQRESYNTYSEFAEWISSQARQLFRAIRADDTKAVEMTLYYLRGFLVKVLARHLSEDQLWEHRNRWLDGLGLAPPEFSLPKWLKFQDELVWVRHGVEEEHWYADPFEFELELCPVTGDFGWYKFRFGDFRSLSTKELSSSSVKISSFGHNDESWMFIYHFAKIKDNHYNLICKNPRHILF